MFFRLLPAISALFGLPMFDKFRKWNLPAPNPWEYAWFVSVFAAIVGWRSLPRNKTVLLKQFMIGTVVFGILPVLYGIMDQMDDLFLYINHRKYKAEIAGYPAVIVWFMFLAITLQLHGFAIYFSAQLLRAWKPRGNEKKVKWTVAVKKIVLFFLYCNISARCLEKCESLPEDVMNELILPTDCMINKFNPYSRFPQNGLHVNVGLESIPAK